MAESINLKIPIKIIGPDGTTLFSGTGLFGSVVVMKAVAVTITAGQAICIDNANSVVFGGDQVAGAATGVAAENVYAGRTQVAASFTGAIGTALTAATALNTEFVVAGSGSIALTACLAADGVVGRHANGGAAAGDVTSVVAVVLAPLNSLGHTTKKAGTTGGVTDTGNNLRQAVLISPHSS